MADIDPRAIWLEAVEKVKDRTISPTLWRALEAAQGVVVEDDNLVVGLSPADFPMSGHLLSSEHKNSIELAISEISGRRLRFRVIEGVSAADWESAKRREAAADASRQAAEKKRQEEMAASKTWEGVTEQVSRKYANTPLRQLPQVRARYLAEAVRIICDAMETLYPSGRKADELTERSFARLIERVASLADIPAVEVADRILRHRAETKGS